MRLKTYLTTLEHSSLKSYGIFGLRQRRVIMPACRFHILILVGIDCLREATIEKVAGLRDVVGVLLECLSLLGSNASKSTRAYKFKVSKIKRLGELLQFLVVGKSVRVGNLQ